ncbi:MAG TPA: FkbM family methyltransferase [Verrucomicrobiae bacterium]|nr:FkbM family methyltransferase [Verrucomicrobiae bacterium]
MQPILIRQITRRNPFKVKKVPWIARVYAYPFDRWPSLGSQALFGAPNFALFLLFQRFSPFRAKGIFSYTIEGHEKLVRFDSFNTQFCALYRKSFAHGYEPQISALLDVLLPADGVFYDIGSNWGWFSLLLASKDGFRGVIHAFEPFPSSYQDLCQVVEQAGLTGRVKPHDLAVSDQEGSAQMHLTDHFQSGTAQMEEARTTTGQIKTAALDALGLEPPSLIKVDVEGAEAKVFKGGRKLLSEHKPMIVFENSKSVHEPGLTLAPLAILHELGYEFFQVGWLRKCLQTAFVAGDDADPAPQTNETLCLVKFELPERFLRQAGINIFACHRDKYPQLKTLFKDHAP